MPKFEILSVAPADPPQWTGTHGAFNAYELELKGEDGVVFKAGVNQKPTSPVPEPGFVYGDAWQNENGFWKFKRDRAVSSKSTGPANFTTGEGVEPQMHPSLLRREAQKVAVLYAAAIGERDLNKIEAWTDHFVADVERAAGTGQVDGVAGVATSPSPQANGEAKISESQITNFILKRQKMYGISDEDMALLVKSFGVEKLRDLPRSKVDAFAAAMPNPIPTGESDVPSEPIPAPASEADEALPF